MSGVRSTIAIVAAVVLMSGCSHYEPPSMHGAASLRVESEVYKGPATLSISAQIGQNTAVLADLARALDVWLTEARAFYPDIGYYAVGEDACRPWDKDSQKAQANVRTCATPPDLWHSNERSSYIGPLVEYPYALPDESGVCRSTGGTGTSGATLDDWKDCAALGAAIGSAERAIVQVCFIINSPAFGKLRIGTSLPFNTCEKNAYKVKWEYLLREHPIADDLKTFEIGGDTSGVSYGPGRIASEPPANQSRFLPGPPVSANEPDGFRSGELPAAALPRALGEEEGIPTYAIISEAWNQCQALADTAAKATVKALTENARRFPALKYRDKLPDGPTAAAFTCYREPIIIAMESLATTLTASALRAADSTIRHVPKRRQFRGLIAAYAYIASEYGGQISARVNILNKAMVDGRDVRGLPTSDFLRGADSTDFIHLMEWLDAADKSYGITFADYPDLPSRVRMAERLNASSYWEKFNEVYTSGQGEVAMAFVKNELGNWDLKGFRSDPAKLLAAYRKTTDAVLASAAKLASKAASGGATAAVEKLSASARAVTLANQLAGAETPGTGGGPDTAGMHARVIARIEARRDSMVQELAKKQGEIAALQAKPAITPEEQKTLGDLQAYVSAMPGVAALSYRMILDDHAQWLTMAQETIATPPAPASAKK